jgi:hypothetical protein
MRAIACRIPESDLLQTTQILALEHMIEKWGYQEKNLGLLLGHVYKSFSSSQTIGLISNLNASGLEDPNIYKSQQKKEKITKRIWDIYFNLENPIIRKFNKLFVKKAYFFIFLFKPRHIFKNKWK